MKSPTCVELFPVAHVCNVCCEECVASFKRLFLLDTLCTCAFIRDAPPFLCQLLVWA